MACATTYAGERRQFIFRNFKFIYFRYRKWKRSGGDGIRNVYLTCNHNACSNLDKREHRDRGVQTADICQRTFTDKWSRGSPYHL